MEDIDNPPFRILYKDAAGTQFESKRPAEVSNLLSKIPIPLSEGSLISITAKSKDSQRHRTEAPSPEASCDVKGASFVEQLSKNESPWNYLAINFKENSKLNISNASSSSSRLRSVFTTLFWSGLWVSFTVFIRKDPVVKKANERKVEDEEIWRIIGMSPAMAAATARGLQIKTKQIS